MTQSGFRVEPVVSFPPEAVAGETYLITIDLQASDGWPFTEEEYPVYCMLEGAPHFTSQKLGAGAVVLHRFGGSYGAAQFLITAGEQPGAGQIVVLLVTSWGAPLGSLRLPIPIVTGSNLQAPRFRPQVVGSRAGKTDEGVDPRVVVEFPRPELTPLSAIEGFSPTLIEGLRQYWITSAEEFDAVVRSSNARYTTGLTALTVALKRPARELEELARAAFNYGWGAVEVSPVQETPLKNALIEQANEVAEISLAVAPDTPPIVGPLGVLPPPRSEGQRNTCVAFALADICAILADDDEPLSPQFLYWACKERDGVPGDKGTSPQVAMKVLEEIGICREELWPYRPEPSDDKNPGHGPPPPAALADARRRRSTGWRQIGSRDVKAIKAALATGKPVLLGIKSYQHWNEAAQGTRLGRLRPPLPGERPGGGRALALIGYRDDPEAPGGGYFIARNSWGTDWATMNIDGPGHCHVAYALVESEGLSAHMVEGMTTGATLRPGTMMISVLTRSADGWRVHARTGPIGQMKGLKGNGVLVLDLDELKLQTSAPPAYGLTLGEALFRGDIHNLFVGQLAAAEGPLRVLLSIEDPELANLHWELLQGPMESQWELLAGGSKVQLIRYEPIGQPWAPAPVKPEGLRALIAVASPANLQTYGIDHPVSLLSVRDATDALQSLSLTVLSEATSLPPSRDALVEEMRVRRPDILHLFCHAHQVDGEVAVFLNAPSQPEDVNIVTASQLGDILMAAGAPPSLIFLAGPGDTYPQEGEPLQVLARWLVHTLAIPAVIVVTGWGDADMTRSFTTTFYERLLAHRDVAQACAEALNLVDEHEGTVTAMLFTRVSSGPLFSLATAPTGASLVYLATDNPGEELELYPNGIDVTTGFPLLRIDASMASKLARSKEGGEPKDRVALYKAKRTASSTGHL